ncbi:MAG: NAD+ synthase [Candidatus Bathyarchaeia archaeon]
MKLTAQALNLDWPEVDRRVCRFIKDYVERSKAKGVVLGLSGGIDSCTIAALSTRALGGHNVLGLLLFEKETRRTEDVRHAELVAKEFGFKTETVDITPTLEAFYRSTPIFDRTDKLNKGNAKARTRMIYVYYYANRLHLIVCGSSDKSETMMGYFTKWGDVAADISPIMDLYKTQVRKLAQYIGVPEAIVEKPSSPALWPGQLAENELGIKYEQLDLILFGLERFMRPEEIAAQLHMEKHLIDEIKCKWLSAEHKRRMLLTAKLQYRTVGADFRLQRNPP